MGSNTTSTNITLDRMILKFDCCRLFRYFCQRSLIYHQSGGNWRLHRQVIEMEKSNHLLPDQQTKSDLRKMLESLTHIRCLPIPVTDGSFQVQFCRHIEWYGHP
jgi:hypothetical protein